VKIDLDADELFDAAHVIFDLLIQILRRFLELSPFYQVWYKVASFVYDMIRDLWSTLTSGAERPEDAKPPTLS
jgi:hypothetical protein